MKNYILVFAFSFLAGGLFAQSNNGLPSIDQTMETLTGLYQLDGEQQAEMLAIQERKLRNLGEIENLKTSDPQLYKKKIESIQHANIAHMHKLLNEEQLKTFRQKQLELREQKAELFKELRGNGAQQAEIEKKMVELDFTALFES